MSHNRLLAIASVLLVVPLALTGCGVTAPPVVEIPDTQPTAEPEKADESTEPTEGFTALADDTGTITVEVPEAWTDVDGAPQETAVVLSAAPDLPGFYSSWASPGVSIFATQSETIGVDGYIEEYVTQFGADCEDGEIDVYDDGLYAGKYMILPNCGGVGSQFVVVAATDEANTMIVVVTMTLVSEEDQTVNGGHIVDTFYVTF